MNTLITGSISNVNSLKDKTLKVVLHCQEMPPIEAANLLALQNEYAKIYISTENVLDEVKEAIDSEVIDREDKSPSQRMRAVFYRLWEQDQKGYEDFQLYYRFHINKLIEQLKDRLQ